MDDRSCRRVAAVRCGGMALALLLAACSVQPWRVDEVAVHAFAVRGYAAAVQAAVSVSRHDWSVAREPVTVVLARPVDVAAAPLLIYLPGLGESSDAGAQWRMAWAAAGYAVLSVQPLADDALAWRSPLAREGEFKALGQERYAAAAMRRRVQVLSAAVDEARRRAIAGDAGWQGIDWDRRAVAGFDLGAYTAMALAGEQIEGSDSLSTLVPVRAAIAFSPYMNLANGRLDTRYGAVFGPVLSVTGEADGDPLGLVAGAAQRLAPFDGMPGPDKYLLLLRGLVHARFDGDGAAAETEQAADARGRRAETRSGDDGGGTRGRGGRHRSQGDDRAGDGGADADEPGARGGRGGEGALSPTAVRLRLTAAQQISTAFLDAYVKDDPLAREWLAGSAARWLGAAGELRHK
jgi:predicted dienelactone hydrolase